MRPPCFCRGHFAEVDTHGNLLIWPADEGKLSHEPQVDPITLDIIENALKNARFEMDNVVVRIALSPACANSTTNSR
jgi:hypothetical protein